MEKTFDFWLKDQGAENEDDMEKVHYPFWKSLIEQIADSLENTRVLDFGCNQGAFLRLLYAEKPFKFGVGVDLASKAIEIAKQRKGTLPLKYYNTSRPDRLESKFEFCFSNSVLYFIEDFKQHANIIYDSLSAGGIYYATYTDFNYSSSLQNMENKINKEASLPFAARSLPEIAEAFSQKGFSIAVKREMPQDFISYDKEWYPDIYDFLKVQYEYSYILKFQKPQN